jgi:hypothetical protein
MSFAVFPPALRTMPASSPMLAKPPRRLNGTSTGTARSRYMKED